MSQASPSPHERARSYGAVADVYDRARPSYPHEAVAWMVGPRPMTVLELGAGTGKLTEVLLAAGHQVLATDPAPEMLRHLARRAPAPHAVARAEELPVPSRSVDVVVCAQSFHCFDHDLALAEIGRVLRPGGSLALAWNDYDVSVPWVRRLAALLEPGRQRARAATEVERGPEQPLLETPYFGFVERRSFRFWQPHTAATLADYARSTSYVATLPEGDRDQLLDGLRRLYDDYGRGPDGMQLPWQTHCFSAVVRPEELPADVEPAAEPDLAPERPAESPATSEPGQVPGQVPGQTRDPGFPLIDFR